MLEKLINEHLTLNSNEIKEIRENATILRGFLAIAKKIDILDSVEKRFYEWSRSLYQATATGESMENLENILKEFFGLPVKPIGKGLPFKLRLNSSVKQLNGIKDDQALYIKKLKTGEFYGALFPWQKNSDKIEIHLGFSASKMTEGASAQLSMVAKKYLSKTAMDQMDVGVGGTIRGIGLPSFLQMSEMEGSSFTLKISSNGRVGYLYVNEGKLIGAETKGVTGQDAAYHIISWENVSIEIEDAQTEREDEIQQPLMHVLMESLKIKDEASPVSESDEFAPAPPPPPKGKGLSSDAYGIPIAGPSVGPFERVAPPPPVARKKKSKAMGLLLAMGIGLPILAVLGLVGNYYFKKFQMEAAYQDMMFAVDSEIDPNEKERQLIGFMDKFNPKDHLGEIEAQIKGVRQQIETKDYENVILKVGILKIDDSYAQKAAEIYKRFLIKYPQGRYADEIKSALNGIDDLIDNAYYQRLQANEKMDMGQRFDAYQDYLERFPKGSHRKDVENLLMDMGEQYYFFIKSQVKACDKSNSWEKCIVFCENYSKVFEKNPRVKEVANFKKEMLDKQEFQGVILQAEKLGDNYIAKQNLYKRYLAGHPKSAANDLIHDAIDDLKSKVADQKQWLNLQAYAKNSNYSAGARLKRVENYLAMNDKGTYSRPVRELYEHLLMEKVYEEKQQRQQYRSEKEISRQKMTEAQSRAIAARVTQISGKFADRIKAAGRRFRVSNDNQTVSDTVTGNQWALLDSNQHYDYCLNYTDAQTYVANLNWGGYRDWRLPTSQELASLYKSQPFFPNNDTPWYWTSESYAKGHHNVANIVSSKHEKSFIRQNADQNKCGAVRAIRP